MKCLTKITGTSYPPSTDIDDIFMILDENGDSSISYEEYSVLMNKIEGLFIEDGITIK